MSRAVWRGSEVQRGYRRLAAGASRRGKAQLGWLNTADKPMAETMRQRVSASLKGLRGRGSLTSSEGRGAAVLGSVAI